jgi:hypothetical protein
MLFTEVIAVCSEIHMKHIQKVIGPSDFGSFLSSCPEFVNPFTISRISHTAVASQRMLVLFLPVKN